ncbi:PREDICTED: probable lipid desaturase ADS3.2, chloroplastic [Brassica oleracea var. oleracea]|uniref:probable lipid desaturase ADS3.2, chloroplastic n=1 Tax=Brassica oleracea var. oleracea TaxID=109376 RepID=UPI0006A713DF|nr:PREDICTED: probable lipid desaturase ADS3.2, chloroplastic [Brassica oleracea var. oleracea]
MNLMYDIIAYDFAFRLSVWLCTIFGICITLSYHRNLSHRSFDLPKWLEYLFAYGGVLAFQVLLSYIPKGDPIEWVSNHRYHHKHRDTQRDPHSPIQGFWFSHITWISDFGSIQKKCGGEENVNDLVRQPFYRFLQRTLYLRLIAFGFLLHIWGGMPFLVWGMGVANVARSHSTFLVNSVCHTWGTRAWNTPDLSRNNWLLAILMFGEVWHNNHHAFEFSARHGLEWWQLDVTWYTTRKQRHFRRLSRPVRDLFAIGSDVTGGFVLGISKEASDMDLNFEKDL